MIYWSHSCLRLLAPNLTWWYFSESYYKIRQRTVYYKVITKCDKVYYKGITKCDKFTTKVLQSVTDCYYKVRRNTSQSFRSSRPRSSVKKGFLEISQNLQENTCARVSFLIVSFFFIKKETLAQVSSCEFLQNF